MKTALTIAGSDCSGGAGIQADLKTMAANGVYGMSAITALTAQNTTGVTGIMEVPPGFLAKQLDMVFTDIRPDAVKTGMIASPEQIRVIAQKLQFYQVRNLVVDPVMVASSGARLLVPETAETLKRELFPLAALVTPNIPEAQWLSGMRIHDEADLVAAAAAICNLYGCPVLLKGGHSTGNANDLLYHRGHQKWFYSKRIDNPNSHGTGCTLSSAIAANLAKGYPLETAVQRAKDYVCGALAAMLDLGRGSGPLNHTFSLNSPFSEEPFERKEE